MDKNFIKNEAGDTNIISIVIVLVVVIVLVLLFKDYVTDLIASLFS